MAYKRTYTKKRASARRSSRKAAASKRRTAAKYRRYVRRYRKTSTNKLSASTTFPSALLAKFDYYDSKLYTPLSGLATYNKYCVTSLYDPDATGAGTTVLHYNKLLAAQVYRFYKVYAAIVNVRLVNESNFPCSVQLLWGPRSTVYTAVGLSTNDTDQFCGNQRNFMIDLGASTGSKNIRNLSLTVYPHTVYGKTKKAYSMDHDFDYAYSNSPIPTDNFQTDFIVNVIGGVVGGSNATPSVVAQVHIKYLAKLFDFAANTQQT